MQLFSVRFFNSLADNAIRNYERHRLGQRPRHQIKADCNEPDHFSGSPFDFERRELQRSGSGRLIYVKKGRSRGTARRFVARAADVGVGSNPEKAPIEY